MTLRKTKSNTNMQSNEREAPVVAVRNTRSDYLTEAAFANYWRLLAWPVLITLTVLFFAIQSDPTFALWRDWLVRGVMFVALAIRARLHDGRRLPPVLYANALAGLVLGIGCALFRIIDDFALYKLFTLITVPAATILVGTAVAWLTFAATEKFGTLKLVRLLPQRQPK